MTPAPKPDPAILTALAALAEILEEENQALSRSDFRASGDLAARKRAAIGTVEACASEVSAEAGRDHARFDGVRRRLDRAIEQNRALLQQAIGTQQRVISTIVQALEPCPDGTPYPGRSGSTGYGRAMTPMALAVRA
jgi:FlgN protein.